MYHKHLYRIQSRLRRLPPPHRNQAAFGEQDCLGRNPDLLVWKGGVLTTLYRQETLDSDLARSVFVLPDKLREL